MSLPFAAGSDTSRAAAEAMPLSKAAADCARVLEVLRHLGEYGATVDELEVLLELRHQTCSARVSEMANKFGTLKDSGLRRLTRSRRFATVWVEAP